MSIKKTGKVSIPHPDATFLVSNVNFRAGATHRTKTPAGDGKPLVNEVVKAVVFKYGYQEAKNLFNAAIESHKSTFID